MTEVAVIGTRGYPSYYGGFETLVRKLAPYMVSKGLKVTVYSRRRAVKADDPNRNTNVNVQYSIGIESRSLSTISYGLTGAIIACFKRPDVALVMNVANGLWLPLLKFRRIPIVLNVDGIEWEREKWGRVAKAIFRTGAWISAKCADELVFDAVAIGDYWKDNYSRTGTFIPYGGEDSYTSVGGLPFDPGTYVLYVARFVPENTIHEFLSAVESHADIPVVIVGSTGHGGELDKRVYQASETNSKIKWLGHVSDDNLLFTLWENCGVYFHGHSVGGTNPALVQAMACGAPVVARDTIYNREVLADSAAFVKPNAADIAESIKILMNDRALRANGARRNCLNGWFAAIMGYGESSCCGVDVG